MAWPSVPCFLHSHLERILCSPAHLQFEGRSHQTLKLFKVTAKLTERFPKQNSQHFYLYPRQQCFLSVLKTRNSKLDYTHFIAHNLLNSPDLGLFLFSTDTCLSSHLFSSSTMACFLLSTLTLFQQSPPSASHFFTLPAPIFNPPNYPCSLLIGVCSAFGVMDKITASSVDASWQLYNF